MLTQPARPSLRRSCLWKGQAHFLQNLLLLQLSQISTGKPCTLATSCISPSYTWFLLVLALLLTLFPLGQGSANFLCKGPDTKHFRLCGCRVSVPTQLCHHEHESRHRNRWVNDHGCVATTLQLWALKPELQRIFTSWNIIFIFLTLNFKHKNHS